MHHAIGALAIIGLVGFAFGERVARVCVGTGLVAGVLLFLYIMVRIAAGTI